MSVPKNASIPPKIGEYAYYDSRLARTREDSNLITNHTSWIVNIDGKGTFVYGCNYSFPENNGDQLFISCHGIINKIVKTGA